jgi:hypothetical protein
MLEKLKAPILFGLIYIILDAGLEVIALLIAFITSPELPAFTVNFIRELLFNIYSKFYSRIII